MSLFFLKEIVIKTSGVKDEMLSRDKLCTQLTVLEIQLYLSL